jgi:hypothetical protein
MIHTPWGSSQTQTRVAEGITRHSTASHGGYFLDARRWEQFQLILPDCQLWAGPQWFEEDCDYALVTLAFPDLFTTEDVHHAVVSVLHGDDKDFRKTWLTGTEEGLKRLIVSQDFVKENATKWQAGSMSCGSGKGWRVSLTRVGDGVNKIVRMEMPRQNFYTDAELEPLLITE